MEKRRDGWKVGPNSNNYGPKVKASSFPQPMKLGQNVFSSQKLKLKPNLN
jgi:hypothetical protein